MSLQSLEDLEAFLRSAPERLPEIVARAAPEIQDAARAMYRSGVGPAGVHAPRKKDGALALQRPLSGVTFTASGDTIKGEAEDVLRYHQGPIRTAPYPERKTFPSDGDPLPSAWQEAIEDAAESVLEEAAEGLR